MPRWLGCLAAALAIGSSTAEAQLADPGKNDQFISLFLQNGGGETGWLGGVTAKGDVDLDRAERFNFGWQLDYGSNGKRVTASDAVPRREPDVSKNSGAYYVSYVRRFGPTWLFTADGGVEHQRTSNDSGGIDNNTAAVGNASLRNIGARKLGDQRAPEFSWLLQANLTTTDALTIDGDETRTVFFDPVGVVWLSFLSRVIPAARDQDDPLLTYRFQLRAEVAGMRAFDSDLDAEGHFEASLTYFFTPANGIMVRRFGGFFDHNLRDRKEATTLNIVWKFK